MIGKPDYGKRRSRKNGPQLQRQQTNKFNSRGGNAGFSRGKELFQTTLPSGEVIALFIPARNRRGSKYSGGMA